MSTLQQRALKCHVWAELSYEQEPSGVFVFVIPFYRDLENKRVRERERNYQIQPWLLLLVGQNPKHLLTDC